MLSFPNCKINLGLNVLRKRSDGYHDLDTVFYPLPLRDALEVVRIPDADLSTGPLFSASGLPVPGDAESNLCVKAWHLLKKDHPSLPPVRIHLHKAIPMGAGLGGGSADGAFALQLIEKVCGLTIPQKQMEEYALQLGSDCPFFLINKPCHAGSRGELLEPVGLDLSGYRFVVVHPGIHVSTARAFAGIVPRTPAESVREVISRPVSEWKNRLFNDFETPVFEFYPQIRELKEEMYEQGAVYASMSGSGSSVFGMFQGETLPVLNLHPTCEVHYIK